MDGHGREPRNDTEGSHGMTRKGMEGLTANGAKGAPAGTLA
jgi:hypothetical protein